MTMARDSRLRADSVSFYSDHERLLRYFLPHPAQFYIPFNTKRCMLNSSLVLLGREARNHYSLKTVIAHYNEVRGLRRKERLAKASRS